MAEYFRNIHRRTILALFFLALTLWQSALGQGLCDDTSAEVGNFAIVSPSGICGDRAVTLTDLSGGDSVRYVFDYKGGSVASLDFVLEDDNKHTYVAEDQPKSYTILQYGIKDDKPMYACQNVIVRSDDSPKFSLTTCSSWSDLEVGIPIDAALNVFDSYSIQVGGNPIETIAAADLPFQKIYPVILPEDVIISGNYLDPTKSCGVAKTNTLQAQTIPTNPNTGKFDIAGDVNINALTMISDTEAILNFSGSYDSLGYEFHTREVGEDYFGPVFKGIEPGDFMFNIPDPKKQYCFQLQLKGTKSGKAQCIGQYSAEICTTPFTQQSLVNNDITLAFDSYPDTLAVSSSTVKYGYNDLIRTREIEIFKDGVLIKSEPVSFSDATFTESLVCANKYCFRLKTKIEGYFNSEYFQGESVSQMVCPSSVPINTDWKLVASVDDNNNPIISFENKAPLLNPVENYYLSQGAAINVLGPTEATFTDLALDASSQSICYKVSFIDACGDSSEVSDEACTIHLSFQGEDLVWSADEPFSYTVISDYDIEGKDETNGTFSRKATEAAGILQLVAPLAGFNNEAVFRIKAVSPDGSVSYSNTVLQEITDDIFIPDAFSPDGDSHNPEFKLFGSTFKITELKLQLYDRWGAIQFTTDNVNFKWDGTNNSGDALPEGTYYYRLRLKMGTHTIDKVGEVWLLREL